MVETDIYKYSLNSDGRNQSLKISLINNSHVALVLTNKDTQKKVDDLNFDITNLKISVSSFDESENSIEEITNKHSKRCLISYKRFNRIRKIRNNRRNILKYIKICSYFRN